MNSILNNSFMGIPDPIEPARKMQQNSDLLSIRFINDFHWRREQNKGRQNKGSRLVLQSRTIPSQMLSIYGNHLIIVM